MMINQRSGDYKRSYLITFVTISSGTHVELDFSVDVPCFVFYYFTLLHTPLAFYTDRSLESKTRRKTSMTHWQLTATDQCENNVVFYETSSIHPL